MTNAISLRSSIDGFKFVPISMSIWIELNDSDGNAPVLLLLLLLRFVGNGYRSSDSAAAIFLPDVRLKMSVLATTIAVSLPLLLYAFVSTCQDGRWAESSGCCCNNRGIYGTMDRCCDCCVGADGKNATTGLGC